MRPWWWFIMIQLLSEDKKHSSYNSLMYDFKDLEPMSLSLQGKSPLNSMFSQGIDLKHNLQRLWKFLSTLLELCHSLLKYLHGEGAGRNNQSSVTFCQLCQLKIIHRNDLTNNSTYLKTTLNQLWCNSSSSVVWVDSHHDHVVQLVHLRMRAKHFLKWHLSYSF